MSVYTISGTAQGNAPGTQQINVIIDIATPLGAVTKTALSSGLNTITIPTGTKLIIVQLPAGNSTDVTLKGVTGDTGIPLIADSGVAAFQPKSTNTTFALTAGGAITSLTTITFL